MEYCGTTSDITCKIWRTNKIYDRCPSQVFGCKKFVYSWMSLTLGKPDNKCKVLEILILEWAGVDTVDN